MFAGNNILGTAQGMFGGLRRGFNAGGQALHPYSNRLMLAGMGMLGGGPKDAMKGLVAGSALDTEDADKQKLNKAIAALQSDTSVMSGLSPADWNYLQADPTALSTAFGARLKPHDPLDMYNFTEVDGTLMRTNKYTGESEPVYNSPGGGENAPKLSDISTLRKDFENQPGTSRYRQSIPQLNSMASSINDTSKMSDYDFVYGLAQIFDPGSVVRESEQGFVLSGQSVPDTVRGQLATILAGGSGVSVTARQALVAAAKRRVDQYRKQAEQEAQYFKDIANRHNIDPADVVRGLEEMSDINSAGDVPFTVEP